MCPETIRKYTRKFWVLGNGLIVKNKRKRKGYLITENRKPLPYLYTDIYRLLRSTISVLKSTVKADRHCQYSTLIVPVRTEITSHWFGPEALTELPSYQLNGHFRLSGHFRGETGDEKTGQSVLNVGVQSGMR